MVGIERKTVEQKPKVPKAEAEALNKQIEFIRKLEMQLHKQKIQLYHRLGTSPFLREYGDALALVRGQVSD